ncbi:MAG: hypothetical protein FRX49_02648 [Trebouxia sp. A1-2]|nr:MAG: hypothetical protein FRX49_02648 [Trebouxia sp. A1-2]
MSDSSGLKQHAVSEWMVGRPEKACTGAFSLRRSHNYTQDTAVTSSRCTFDIPDLQSAIKHATPNEAPIMVVGTGSHSNSARLGQLRLDDSLLQHVPGVPHTYGAILAAGHASVAVCGMPLGMGAGTDVSLGVSQVPNVHVTRQADPTLFTVPAQLQWAVPAEER